MWSPGISNPVGLTRSYVSGGGPLKTRHILRVPISSQLPAGWDRRCTGVLRYLFLSHLPRSILLQVRNSGVPFWNWKNHSQGPSSCRARTCLYAVNILHPITSSVVKTNHLYVRENEILPHSYTDSHAQCVCIGCRHGRALHHLLRSLQL
ncbi:hypothetical protein BJV78DRAFT_158737 [Lactifluus subvellereus]|nr:hypothetical protein BJV78DRAFT_158737 [Lactifluus subvellereus]